MHREESSYPLLGIGVVDTFQNARISKGLTQRIERVARDRVDLLIWKIIVRFAFMPRQDIA